VCGACVRDICTRKSDLILFSQFMASMYCRMHQ